MTKKQSSLFSPVLIAGCIILMAGFSIRASFGLFQIPIAEEFNWLRSEFSLAIAIQNLAWGVGQPLFAAFAEKFGERPFLIIAETGETLDIPAHAVSAVDTTGAGDTFTGYVLSGLDRSLPMPQAMTLAARAAALMVTRPGTADVIPDLKEVQEARF